MKKHFSALLAFVLLIMCCTATAEVRSASTAAFGGTLSVEVLLENEKIVSVTVTQANETEGIGSRAIDALPSAIVEAQSTEIDGVAGATITSNAIMTAVDIAINGRELFNTEDTEADVVVIGAGGAGLAAALRAAENGAKVIVLEKQGHFGGNTAMTGYVYGCSNSSVHKAEGKTQTVEDHFNYYRAKASATATFADPEAAWILAENSGPSADWLMSLGLEFSHTTSNYMLSCSRSSVGRWAIELLSAEGEKLGVDYRLENRATGLLMDNGKISGVTVSTPDGDYTISAKAVVIATGGFEYCDDLITRYVPQWNGYPRRCSPALTGDGHLMAEAVGAAFRDMEVVKGNPFMHIDQEGKPVFLSELKTIGAMLVNKQGWRFTSEDNHYVAGVALRAQTDGEGYFIFGQSVIDSNKDAADYVASGYAVTAPTLEEIADLTGIYKPQLLDSVEKFIGLIKSGKDTDYGRTNLVNSFENESAYYAIKVRAALQGTFGGIAVDTSARVLTAEGAVIEGLYAAGECAGDGLRGLNPMTTNIVYGGIAGTNAAAFAGKKATSTHE